MQDPSAKAAGVGTVRDAVQSPGSRILGMVANPYMTRDDIAFAYAEMLRDGTIRQCAAEVNAAIVERWSMSALKYIKRKAWGRAGTMSR